MGQNTHFLDILDKNPYIPGVVVNLEVPLGQLQCFLNGKNFHKVGLKSGGGEGDANLVFHQGTSARFSRMWLSSGQLLKIRQVC